MYLPSLLYGSDSWATYKRPIKALEKFHYRPLRKSIYITCQDMVTKTSVLNCTDLTSIAAMLIKNQQCWSGHVVLVTDTRPPKQIFILEISKVRCMGPAKPTQ